MSQGQTVKDEQITDNMGRSAADVKPSNGGWTPPNDNPFVPSTTYIQIILGEGAIDLSEVRVAGSVESYMISLSTDLIFYHNLSMAFEGHAKFLVPELARSIRIYPLTLLTGEMELNVTIELYACFEAAVTTQPGATTQPPTTIKQPHYNYISQPTATRHYNYSQATYNYTGPPTPFEGDGATFLNCGIKCAAQGNYEYTPDDVLAGAMRQLNMTIELYACFLAEGNAPTWTTTQATYNYAGSLQLHRPPTTTSAANTSEHEKTRTPQRSLQATQPPTTTAPVTHNTGAQPT
ncbi:PREDICTED: uncharacterized protein LOC106815993 [Priapulus caudatus]|uniref:Uncharacterized protein LOC106815993 n=1 Tax=Priapulus caudatus TaxID=37621 RepID=A0ABM1EUY9_PRICU|nr:PREDICTED: uncharacterized protein LOC106815993 [Priapulus caudatus]